jgi:hypothetical protein
MSVVDANICPAILTSLFAEGVQSEDKINARAGTLGALNSAENRFYAPTVKGAFNDGGHHRQVRLAYKQRTTEADASDSKSCGGCAENPYLEIDFNVTSYKEVCWKVSESTVRAFCRAYSDDVRLRNISMGNSAIRIGDRGSANVGVLREMAQEFMYQAPGLVDAINHELQEQFALALGSWQGCVGSKNFTVQNSDANGAGPNFAGLSQFYQELDKIGWNGTPHVINGFGALNRLIGMGGTAYCCSELGINFEQIMSNVRFRSFTDRFVSTVQESDNAAIIFYPGMANFIQYLEYADGNMSAKIDNIWRMSIPLPGVPGVMVDLRIIENGCDEDYDFIMGTYFDLFTAPNDMYKDGDWLECVNGVLKAFFTQA